MAVAVADTTEIRFYSCRRCRTQVALDDHIICREIQARRSTRMCFPILECIQHSGGEERTPAAGDGEYIVADVYCHDCNTVLGWKYLMATEDQESQKYKEGKFVIERRNIIEVKED
ncbi:protein yippee-like At4g27745 [Andrographis paniculata]|uniref:protein yippee-like At4g27745 n=1 Tax=Andrographis paniculata TaxID=175694 RepID=UPI0021E95C95|nr:protein yippee-like At4g27745 [Andrographis paniculata]